MVEPSNGYRLGWIPTAGSGEVAIRRFARSLAATGLAVALSPHVAVADVATASSLPPAPGDDLLLPGGNVDLTTGFQGTLDLAGVSLVLAPDASPRFLETTGVASSSQGEAASFGTRSHSGDLDDHWAPGFGDPTVGGVDGHVSAMTILGGELYIGGVFSAVGGVAVNNVAKWNGSAWEAVGTATHPAINAFAVIGTDLYAGGGQGWPYLAKWDGTSWSPVGSEAFIGEAIYAMQSIGTDLYVGGKFDYVGDLEVLNIAKWDGTQWSALGNGVGHIVDSTAYVHSLAAIGTDLYVGGSLHYTVYQLYDPAHLLRWDGSTWWHVGSDRGGPIFAMAADGTDLYVGGYFPSAVNRPKKNVAKWDGTGWSDLGAGLNQTVYALAVTDTGVYAGGSFSNSGSTAVRRIAKWDGVSWVPLGSGVGVDANDGVAALATLAGELFVGGTFVSTGGWASSSIGRWVEFELTTCGDGVLDSGSGEQCDDGNTLVGDCCAPNCRFEGSFTVCRASGGVCDFPESCTGTSGTCPSDARSTAVCRIAAGICDLEEACDGLSDQCPADMWKPSGTPCREAAGVCDLVESCSGSAPSCPADARSTTLCRSSAGVCDLAESCDGTGVECPADTRSTALCRGSAGECDVPEFCDGASAACPVDGFLFAGVSCSSDFNPCSDDECDGAGTCTHTPNSAPCDNGLFCDGLDTCSGGSCIVHAGDPCAGGGECADDCNEAADSCFSPAQTPCLDDGELCTDDECDGVGSCEHIPDTSNDPTCTVCPPSPPPDCYRTGAGKMKYSAASPGFERLKLQWKKVVEPTTQEEFGDPVDGDTTVAVCIYDDEWELLEELLVQQAGALCAGRPCWSAKRTKGFSYKDRDLSADGVGKLTYISGAARRGKIGLSAKNNLDREQVELPADLATTLSGNLFPTVQILTSEGLCVRVQFDVRKDDGSTFIATRK